MLHNPSVFVLSDTGPTIYRLGRGCPRTYYKHYLGDGDMISFRAKLAIQLSFMEWLVGDRRLVFATLTLPDGGRDLNVDQFASLFKRFTRSCKIDGSWPSYGFRCWERHGDRRGWHVHLVLPRLRLQWPAIKANWWAVGGGRCHVAFVTGDGGTLALYLANEVGKWQQKNFEDCGRRVRSWSTWGDGRSRCSDIILDTPIGRLLKPWGKLSKGKRFTLIRDLRIALSRGWVPSSFAYVDVREQRSALARFARENTGVINAFTESTIQ